MMTGIAVLLGDGCRLPARSGVSPLIPRGVYLFRAKEQAEPTTLAATCLLKEQGTLVVSCARVPLDVGIHTGAAETQSAMGLVV